MDSKAFRGESGEVVRGFLSIGTCLTAVPIGMATVLLAVLAAFVQERFHVPAAVVVPAYLTLLAPLTGMFAMAARSGATHAGVLEALAGHGGGALGFTVRYGTLQLAWSVPLVVLAQAALPWLKASATAGPGTRLAIAIWAGVALAAASLVLPTLTLLVATVTDTVRDAFSADAWRWALRERRDDLVPYVASALGGMVLFLLAALPPLAFALPIVGDMSPRLAAALVFALPALPWATAPILVGRLAGAFVAAGPMLPRSLREEASEGAAPRTFDVPMPQAGRTVAGLAGIPRGTASIRMDCPTSVEPAREGGAQGVPLGVAIARAHQLAESDMEGCLAELESLRTAHPRNPAVVAELAHALRKAGRAEEAFQAASSAIRLALNGGAGPIAHDVFRAFASDASHLNLEPSIYEQLARILCARREYDGAAWCYRAAAALGGEPKALQKGLLGVAEAALQAGAFDRAASVYDAFVQAWPDSPLARFARDGADQSRRRMQGAPA